ncbi:isochorismate synthase DhbC [Gracilibacillus caseinilyticus]|uniref:isochorismate synthase n=1 Tax=Gracilibacillus caseinilyticus TaxID=2932256 RepID=A0ABY4EW84_9BACI|nr:isochorismate synthase DhbC [Gracilibacillus caseinilyticus]UOQ48670.1 isochorismate synthase DhbC [Gracilibacillus caseinilyticus]
MMLTDVLKQTGNELMNKYEVGDYFLASPNQTLKGSGVFARVEWSIGDTKYPTLAESVQSAISEAKEAGHTHPIVIGAVPFDKKNPAQLVVPEEVEIAGPIEHHEVKEHNNLQASYTLEPVPIPEDYERGINDGLDRIKKGDMEKLVLSRSLRMTSDQPIQVESILFNLAHHNPSGYTFALDLPKENDRPRTLIGASPELLVSKSGFMVMANPLAGSRPRSNDPAEDQRRADELIQSAKDLHEHAVVVRAVKESLDPLCEMIHVPDKPSLIKTETMWHLSTEVKGIVRDEKTSSLELATALHPTPAVCGHPTEAAHEAIRYIEPFDRQYFTGMVGWCNERGDGEWIVTIRCAEATDHSMQLFAGAGVVAGSKAEEELAETGAKMQTMLRAMGIHDN